MIYRDLTPEQRTAFFRGFDLAQPPCAEEADALDRASELAPAEVGALRVAVSKDLGRALLAEVERVPDPLAAATWLGFLRGLVAQAGAAPVHVHDAGRA